MTKPLARSRWGALRESLRQRQWGYAGGMSTQNPNFMLALGLVIFALAAFWFYVERQGQMQGEEFDRRMENVR